MNNKTITKTIQYVLLVALIFLGLELYGFYKAKSHSYANTKSSKQWYKRYWTENTLHFRDSEPGDDTGFDVFFIGDSFTAGSGLKKIDERFSNKWHNVVSKNYYVNSYNLGYEGVDSYQAYHQGLIRFEQETKIKPELIVLQYFGNDIEQRASNAGLKDSIEKITMPIKIKLINKLVERSYFINYFFWYCVNKPSFKSYYSFLEQAYNDPNALKNHYKDLSKFISYAEKNQVTLIVTIIPFLRDMAWSQAIYGNRVTSYFENKNITVINLCTDSNIYTLPIKDRMVSSVDLHASDTVNTLIAERLLKLNVLETQFNNFKKITK